VQVSGVFTGAVQLEGSIDGFAFAPVSSPITAPGFTTIRLAIAYLRVHTRAHRGHGGRGGRRLRLPRDRRRDHEQ